LLLLLLLLLMQNVHHVVVVVWIYPESMASTGLCTHVMV
jgi:hypothetical protein